MVERAGLAIVDGAVQAFRKVQDAATAYSAIASVLPAPRDVVTTTSLPTNRRATDARAGRPL